MQSQNALTYFKQAYVSFIFTCVSSVLRSAFIRLKAANYVRLYRTKTEKSFLPECPYLWGPFW